MLRTLVWIPLLVAVASAKDLVEVEPNDDYKGKLIEIRPGDTLKGVVDGREKDHYALVADEETVVDIEVVPDQGNFYVGIHRVIGSSILRRGKAFRCTYYRLNKTRRVLEVYRLSAGGKTAYTVRVIPRKTDGIDDIEPNEKSNYMKLAPGMAIEARASHPFGDLDFFEVETKRRTTYKLRVIRRTIPDVQLRFQGMRLSIRQGSRKISYAYAMDAVDDEFVFYPVLQPGKHLFRLQLPSIEGLSYRIELHPFDSTKGAQLEDKVRAAIEKAEPFLMKHVDTQRTAAICSRAMTIMGLIDSKREGAKQRCTELVKELADLLETWKGPVLVDGKPLRYWRSIYPHCMATLALAEAVAAGIESARAPCEEGIRFLIAAQVNDRRPKELIPQKKSPHWGGWRYRPDGKDGDLSVAGWAIIALYAAEVADVAVEGAIPALEDGLEFTKRCGRPDGFTYQPTVNGTGVVRAAIGVLLCELFDIESKSLKAAHRTLDDHLCAGTQGDHGVPFYYWYYATRANYLRGGYAWEAWRTTVMEQLLKRQLEDGGWQDIRGEEKAGKGYATGLAVAILRMCLNEPPHYLKLDVRGF